MAFKIKYLKWNKEFLVLFLDIWVSHCWFHKPNRDNSTAVWEISLKVKDLWSMKPLQLHQDLGQRDRRVIGQWMLRR